MDLIRAFTLMLGDVTAADASERQVTGILVWREHVREALRLAPAGAPGTQVPAFVPATTHRGWRDAAEMILAALREQMCAADAAAAQAEIEAKAADAAALAQDAAAAEAERAAAMARERAAVALARAAVARGRAAATDDAKAASSAVAEAAAQEAEAARCGAAADAADAAAAEARTLAEGARERAREARSRAKRMRAWGAAAADAHATGARLVVDEDAIAIPVGAALAAAGGIAEVYSGKSSLTTDAARGGAR